MCCVASAVQEGFLSNDTVATVDALSKCDAA